MKHVSIVAALGLACAAAFAYAGDQEGRGKMMERLKAADTNGDGMISKQESAALPRLAKDFDAIDANHDGQVTMDELRAFHEAHRGKGGMKKLDTDGDGRISRAEAAKAPRLAEHFDAIDTNHDGFITPEEMKAAHAKRGGEPK
jgi:Ca2+-binding EF-hand superfamily protein